jgi:hypothetical protein
MTYANNCVDWPRRYVADLTQMIDTANDITRKTFKSHVDKSDLAYLEGLLGYNTTLTMKQDWHVTYHSGKLFGRRVYFFRHSAIEYVFTPQDVKENLSCQKPPVPWHRQHSAC